jgi:hypothetical protein
LRFAPPLLGLPEPYVDAPLLMGGQAADAQAASTSGLAVARCRVGGEVLPVLGLAPIARSVRGGLG